jgi:hypothetical protein
VVPTQQYKREFSRDAGSCVHNMIRKPGDHVYQEIMHTVEKVSEFAHLGDILFVIGAGSVEDERLFSAASFVLSKHRSRLDKSLVECVRGKVHDVFSLDNFPYDRALDL